MGLFIGVDIGKNQLDVFCKNASISFPNTLSGIKSFSNHLSNLKKQGHTICMIVCEPTGGYERQFVKHMHKMQHPIHMAHANKIRYYAKSKGLFAKTDKVDAKLICDYAKVMTVQKDEMILTEDEENIGRLMKRREQLLVNKQDEQNRLETEYISDIRHSINLHIKWIEREIKKIENKLDILSQTKEIKEKLILLSSIPGIGKLTALSLIAFMPELGKINHRQVAALAGVAPYNRDSGTLKGQRHIYGGRAIVRRSIYMSAISSMSWNPTLKLFYERLRTNGKPGKIAIVAVMRKLLIVANSVLERQTEWVANYTKIG